MDKRKVIRVKAALLALLSCVALSFLSACSGEKGNTQEETAHVETSAEAEEIGSVVTFEHTLDSYAPEKQEYNLYFTYKIIHPWWDAVALGMEDAVAQYLERGIVIDFEYLAPEAVSAEDQISRIRDASKRGFDVIGVDVADIDALTPVINELIENGETVMTFSSSDAPKEDGCNRIAYVGNTHNYEDGRELTEVLCEKLEYKGKVAILVGSEGAPCHEDRARGAMDVLSAYPDMKVVAVSYDEDSIDNAYALTEKILADYPSLDGIICCNMSNPVGAARAVIDAGLEESVTIVGMDHDAEALRYLRDGVIYALGVQDCYAIGFDTIRIAVMLADGVLPSDTTYPEKTEEKTTIIFRDGAADLLMVLYGQVE